MKSQSFGQTNSIFCWLAGIYRGKRSEGRRKGLLGRVMVQMVKGVKEEREIAGDKGIRTNDRGCGTPHGINGGSYERERRTYVCEQERKGAVIRCVYLHIGGQNLILTLKWKRLKKFMGLKSRINERVARLCIGQRLYGKLTQTQAECGSGGKRS